MSMQQGAKTVEELIEIIRYSATEMQKFSDCENVISEIIITIDKDDNRFTITSA